MIEDFFFSILVIARPQESCRYMFRILRCVPPRGNRSGASRRTQNLKPRILSDYVVVHKGFQPYALESQNPET